MERDGNVEFFYIDGGAEVEKTAQRSITDAE